MANRAGAANSTAMASTTLTAPDALLADNLGTAFGLGVPYNPFVGGQRHHHPHQHQQQQVQAQNQAQAQPQLPPNANATPAPANAINRFFGLNTSGRTSTTTNPHVNHALATQATIDDAFIHRFISLHHHTLRKFWVVGMRCSEDAIRELCERCERLERVRAEDVDEFPVRSVFPGVG